MFKNDLLNIKKLTVTVNGQVLIKDLSLTMDNQDRLGVVGHEGNGKTLLLRVMAGMKLSGGVKVEGKINRLVRVGYLPQKLSSVELDQDPARFLVGENWEKYNEMGRWSEVFCQIGWRFNWWEKKIKMKDLSGGERAKIMLARVLFDYPDLILLDEPTNYLDKQSMEWLENFCQNFPGGLVVVSHDEVFLQKVANRILHLERLSKRQKNVWRLENVGWLDYCQKIVVEKSNQTREAGRQKRKYEEQMKKLKEVKHKVMMDQITIIDSSARRLLNKKMKTIISQQKKLEKQKLIVKPELEKQISLNFNPVDINPDKIWLDWRDQKIKLPGGVMKVKNLLLKGKENVFITGKNGSGKTQLMRKIYDELVGKGVNVGYVPQNYHVLFSNGKKVVDWLIGSWGNVNNGWDWRTCLARLNFSCEEMNLSVNQLSSGQQLKLILLSVISKSPEVILLDEPMANLSLYSRRELKRAIDEFNGPMVIVSHDRKFVGELADRVYLIQGKNLVEDRTEVN